MQAIPSKENPLAADLRALRSHLPFEGQPLESLIVDKMSGTTKSGTDAKISSKSENPAWGEAGLSEEAGDGGSRRSRNKTREQTNGSNSNAA
jgi:hypothetical protein